MSDRQSQITQILAALEAQWRARPGWRLGQLIFNAIHWRTASPASRPAPPPLSSVTDAFLLDSLRSHPPIVEDDITRERQARDHLADELAEERAARDHLADLLAKAERDRDAARAAARDLASEIADVRLVLDPYAEARPGERLRQQVTETIHRLIADRTDAERHANNLRELLEDELAEERRTVGHLANLLAKAKLELQVAQLGRQLADAKAVQDLDGTSVGLLPQGLDRDGELKIQVEIDGRAFTTWVSREWWAMATPEEWRQEGQESNHQEILNGSESSSEAETPASILDDPRMSGETWLDAADVTQAILDAWPVWSYKAPGGTPILMLATKARSLLWEDAWQLRPLRPLRLPGMNERGEIAAGNMTPEHFERVREWQWRLAGEGPRSWSGVRDQPSMATVRASEVWRPAIFAQLDEPAPADEPTYHCDQARGFMVRLGNLAPGQQTFNDVAAQFRRWVDAPDIALLSRMNAVHAPDVALLSRLYDALGADSLEGACARAEAFKAARERVQAVISALYRGDHLLGEIAGALADAANVDDPPNNWTPPNTAVVGAWCIHDEATKTLELQARIDADGAALAALFSVLDVTSIEDAVVATRAMVEHGRAIAQLLRSR